MESWENDPKLLPILEVTMRRCQQELLAAGHKLTFTIQSDDFILAQTRESLFDSGPHASFQLAILNPPYFKLRKEHPAARAMSHVVHGQPNIYALFMAAATDRLLPNGELVAITPRSYFNGSYFKRFRKWFFDRMCCRQIHAFESRTDSFKEHSVLQENVIVHAEKCREIRDVLLTHSVGRDLQITDSCRVPYSQVIDDSNGEHVIRVPTSRLEREIAVAIDALPCRFARLGFRVSTGRVVSFRSTRYLRDDRGCDTAPLLWMHNVRPYATEFVSRCGKPAHIEVSDSSRRLLVPAPTYVLFKRFTSKEERRRLVAGIIKADDSYSDWVGLENHLNYVYRAHADLDDDEAYGIAAYFNSIVVDRYFRAVSGNTQVNAAEIRSMPLPDEAALRRIGSQVQLQQVKDVAAVEQIIGESLRLPQQLIDRLIEVVG